MLNINASQLSHVERQGTCTLASPHHEAVHNMLRTRSMHLEA